MRQRIIILHGIVEGIGMRPALYRFSVAHGLRGYVCNLSGFVKLLWQGDASRIEQAFAELRQCFSERQPCGVPSGIYGFRGGLHLS